MKKNHYRVVGEWSPTVWTSENNTAHPDQMIVAVLFTIRDLLRSIDRKLSVLDCPRFTRIPTTLQNIEDNTRKVKRKRKPKRA